MSFCNCSLLLLLLVLSHISFDFYLALLQQQHRHHYIRLNITVTCKFPLLCHLMICVIEIFMGIFCFLFSFVEQLEAGNYFSFASISALDKDMQCSRGKFFGIGSQTFYVQKVQIVLRKKK